MLWPGRPLQGSVPWMWTAGLCREPPQSLSQGGTSGLHRVCSQAPRLSRALPHNPHNLLGWTKGRPLKTPVLQPGVGPAANNRVFVRETQEEAPVKTGQGLA